MSDPKPSSRLSECLMLTTDEQRLEWLNALSPAERAAVDIDMSKVSESVNATLNEIQELSRASLNAYEVWAQTVGPLFSRLTEKMTEDFSAWAAAFAPFPTQILEALSISHMERPHPTTKRRRHARVGAAEAPGL